MTAICCPKCGYAGPDKRVSVDAAHIYIDGERIRVTKQQAVVFKAILEGNGRTVEIGTIIDRVWWDDPNGGPLDAKRHVGVQIHGIRHRHPTLSRIIATDRGIGYHIDMDALETKT